MSNSRDCSSSVIVRSASLCASSYSNGPEKTIATSLFGAMPFSIGLLDDAGRRRDAEVAPGLVRVRRRQAGDVGFDQRLDRLGREAADEDEREVARVGEARLVERQRLRRDSTGPPSPASRAAGADCSR